MSVFDKSGKSTCANCNKKFDVSTSNAHGNRLDFCSRTCELEYNKKK